MLIDFYLPVWGTTEHLETAITNGTLVQVNDTLCRADRRTYELRSPDEDFCVHDAFAFELSGQLYACNLFALPSAEYSALVFAQCPQTFDVTGVVQAMSESQPPADLAAAILDSARHGKAEAKQEGGSGHESIWMSCTTRLARTEQGRWFLNLWFYTESRIRRKPSSRLAFGLDVGLDPLLSGANSAGETFTVQPPPAIAPDILFHGVVAAREQYLVERIYKQARYTLARQKLEGVINQLIEEATVVSVEKLDLGGFRRLGQHVDRQLRDLAVLDFLQDWLRHRLELHGIPFYSHQPAYTSQICHRCYHPGQTWQGQFKCQYCGITDRHTNAAQVLCQLGLARQLRTLQGGRHVGL